MNMFFRSSISNFTYNHIGHFSSAAEAVCKSLFMGGVTRRFPTLRFAFLEGGAGWAASLFADLVGHWKKRNVGALAKLDPDLLDRGAYFELCRRYGDRWVDGKFAPDRPEDLLRTQMYSVREDPSTLDEFEHLGITGIEEFHDLFLRSFSFGCEGDDPMTGVAFDPKRNPLNAKLNAVYGSDIGHFDVPEIAEALEEAYESVEYGRISEADFRDFVFANPVKLWTSVNPDFFKGTAVEAAVTAERRG